MGAESTRAVTGRSQAPSTTSAPNTLGASQFAKADVTARAQRDAKPNGGQAQAGPSTATAPTNTNRAVTGPRDQPDKRSNGEPSQGRVTITTQKENASEPAKTTPPQNMDAQSIDVQTAGNRIAEAAARAERGRLGSKARDPAIKSVLDAAEQFPTLVTELRKQRDASNFYDPSLPAWLRGQLQDGTIDVDNLALMKAMGFDANKTAGMSEPEQRILRSNALVSAMLQRHKIRIREGSNLLPVVTTNGATIQLTPEQYEVWRQVRDGGDLAAFAMSLPLNGRDSELESLKAASSLLRVERTMSQVAELMLGDKRDDKAALRLLKTSMDNANIPGERNDIWEMAGKPYFDQAYVDARLREAAASPLKLDWREFLGLYDVRSERVGPWLWQIANEAPAPVVNMALDAVKRDLKDSRGAGDADLLAGLIKGVEVVAETTGVDRSQEFANWWLTRPLPESWLTKPSPEWSLFVPAASLDGPGQVVRDGVEKAGGNPRSPLLQALLKTVDSDLLRNSVREGVNKVAQKAYRENRAALYREFAGRGDEAARRASLEPLFDRFRGPDGKGIDGIALGRGRRFRTHTDQRNFLGQMMGLMPVNVQAARAQDQSQEWYPDNTYEGLQVSWVAYKIGLRGGLNAQVRAIPTVYASKDEGDVRGITLFEVVNADGKATLIDSSKAAEFAMTVGASDLMAGKNDLIAGKKDINFSELLEGEGSWEYTDFKDFLNDNQLDREGMLYRLEGGSGQLAVVGSAAAQWTDTRKAFYYVDFAASMVGLAASILLLPYSGGSSSVPAWVAWARLGMFAFSAYGGLSSGRQLWIVGSHGASLRLSNPEARAHWIGGVGAVIGVGTFTTAIKASALLKAGNSAKAAPWAVATKGLGITDFVLGAGGMADQTGQMYKLAASGADMSSSQVRRAFFFYALGAAQMGIGLAGPHIVKAYRSRTGPDIATPNPKGLPDDLAMSEVVRELFLGVPRKAGKPTPTNKQYEVFYKRLNSKEQEGLPKPGDAVPADQLTRALAQLPGGLEKVIWDIHAHPMGYIQRLDVSLESSEGKVKAGDSYNVSTRDGVYIVTPYEIHLIARDYGSSARWRLDDPDHIRVPTDNGRGERRLAVGADPGTEAGAAAVHLRNLLHGDVLTQAGGRTPPVNKRVRRLRSLMQSGQLSPEGLADRLGLAYGRNVRVTAFTDQSGRHWALIPQLCGGGHAHYSHFDPSKLSLHQREWLDDLAQKEWLRLYHDQTTRDVAAKIDVGIIGLDFSDQGQHSPGEHLDELARRYPGVAWSVGEITARKEMVHTQLGGEAWTLERAKFQAFLRKIADSGHMLLLHNDGGKHAEGEAGRPEAAKTGYEYYDEMIAALSAEKEENSWRKNVNIVIAHTFFGRYVRPDDKSELRVVRVGGKLKQMELPEHIFRMYEVADKIPNARFDISWNDISQAFAHRNLREPFVQFILDHPDRVLFGSDAVKPVNAGHYNQGLYTILPVLAELARRPGGDDALWKVLRGNYEDLRKNAQTRVASYTSDLLKTGRRDQDITEMNGRLKTLKESREIMEADAHNQLEAWVKQVKNLPSLDQVEGEPGVFESLYDILGRTDGVPPPSGGQAHSHDQVGPGTPGGHAHAKDGPQQKEARRLSRLGLTLGAAAVGVLAPLSGETGNNLSFLFRGFLTAYKAGSSRWLRLQFEDIFEQGRATPEKLDQFVNRIVVAQKSLGFSDQQIAQVMAATKQFKANYQYLDERNLPPQRGETVDQRFLKIMAKTGEYQSTVDRILSGQASSITPLDPRRKEGFILRVAQLLTYAINDAAFVHWLSHNGLDTSSPAAKLYSTFRVLFAIGNAVLTGHTAVSLAAGRAGVNWDSTKGMQRTNLGAQALLTTGGGIWTAHDTLQAVTAAGAGQYDAAVAAALKACLDFAFAHYGLKSTKHAENVLLGKAQEAPSEQEKAAILFGTVLFLRMVVELASSNSSEPSAEERRPDSGSRDARPK